MQPVEPGTPLGPVVLGSVLRKGAWSHLYAAQHTRLGIEVTARILQAPPAEDRERFLREAILCSALGHPAVVRAIDFGEYAELRYLISERFTGRSLEQYLAEHREPPSQAAIAKLIARVADALAACHAIGLAHRDLQPEKLFLDPQGQLRIVDFGFAPSTKLLAGTDASVRERSPYLPPECARGDVPVEASADLFALGVIAYRLAFQRLPYGAWIDDEMLAGEPLEPAPFDLPTHCSRPLLDVIGALIDPRPSVRIDDASDLLAVLPDVVRPTPASREPESVSHSQTRPPSRGSVSTEPHAEHAERGALPRFLKRWFGPSTSEHEEGVVVHSSLSERLLVWSLLLGLILAAFAGVLASSG